MGTQPTEDWIALFDLVTRYSRGLDTRDYELVNTVFTSECLITYDFGTVGVDESLLTYTTPEQMTDDARRIHAPLEFTMHQNGNYWFDIDGDSAVGRVYVDLFELRTDRGRPESVHHYGWYNDTYVKLDGAWFIKERRFTFKWTEGEWIGDRPLAEQQDA